MGGARFAPMATARPGHDMAALGSVARRTVFRLAVGGAPDGRGVCPKGGRHAVGIADYGVDFI